MAFFRNDTVNWLNLHYAIHSLALSGGAAFFAVFLLQAGVPAPGVLCAIAAILAGRFVLRPALIPLASRFGLRRMVLAGTVLTGAQYPFLAEVHGVGLSLFVLCVVSSIGDTVYWTAYHAYFARLGDAEHRGQQVGAREAVAAIIGIVGPLLTGWALTAFGPRVAFGATGAVLLCAALPILKTPDAAILPRAPGTLKAARAAILTVAADSFGWAGYGGVWQIALFVSLHRSFTAFGGAMALAALAGAVSSLALGRFIDAGHGRRAVILATGAHAVVILMRVFGYGSPALAVAANAGGALVAAFYFPTIAAVIYNQAQAAPCAFRFLVATEGAWDVGGAAGCLACAALLAAGLPFSAAIATSLVATTALFVLLRRQYARPLQLAPAG